MNTITKEEAKELISKNSIDLVSKLMNSVFFTPLKRENQSMIINTVSDDENIFIRLFDSKEMYEKVETEIKPIKLPFEIIFNMLVEKIDGFILYLGSKEFILDEEFIDRNLKPCSAGELKYIADNLNGNGDSMKDSIFLTLLLSDDDISDKSENGIITQTRDMHFDMATTRIENRFYHLLFTSKEHLKRASELFPDSRYYCQIIDLKELTFYLKAESIEGVLIDFPDRIKFVSTAELLELDIRKNVKLTNSLDYIFEIN